MHALAALVLSAGLGFGVAWQQGPDAAAHATHTLGGPWYDWRWDGSDDDAYMPMVYRMQRDGWSEAALVRSQGDTRTWLLGNEPDWGPETWTDARQAAEFAQWWDANTDAPWACCGVIVTLSGDHWSAWLRHYLWFGGPVPDYWHIHIYNGTPANWHEHVEAFRVWSQRAGVERPIIVSETAYPGGSAEYNALLVEAIGEALDSDPDLLAVYWYSVHDYHGIWHDTDLLTADGALTPVGEAFIRVRSGVRPQREWRMWLPGVAAQ